MNYHLEQNNIFPSSIAHGFCNFITADMINDLEDSHTRRPLPPIKSSHQLSTIFENSLDDSSDNSDDTINTFKKTF